jgi:hypothetical protein
MFTYYCWMECPVCHGQSEANVKSEWVRVGNIKICLDCFTDGILWAITAAKREKDEARDY